MKFLDIFKSKELRDLTEPVIETAIDSITDDGIVKDIPVVGMIFKAYDAVQSIKAKFYARKVQKFFIETADISQEDREAFVVQLDKEEKEIRLFETLQLLIERLNEEDKAPLVGKLFRAAVMGRIDVSDFLRFAYIIEGAYVKDILALKEYGIAGLSKQGKEGLYRAGMAEQIITRGGLDRAKGHGDYEKAMKKEYKLNSNGSRIVELCEIR